MLLVKRVRRAGSVLGGEDGSMVVALLAVVVASGLMMSITAAAFAGHQGVRFDRDHVRAVQGADAGVEEVVYRLGSTDPTTQIVLPATPPPAGTVIVPLNPPASQPAISSGGGGSYRYEVLATANAGEYLVNSYSTLNGVDREVSALVTRPKPFQLVAFADTNMTLRGGNSANSYGAAAWNTGEGNLGSNDKITLNGNVTADDAELHDYDANNNASRCTSNGNAVCAGVDTVGPRTDVSSAEAMAFIDEVVQTPTANCPATPTAFVGSTLAASPLPYCFTTMTITSNFTVTGTGNAMVYLTNPTTGPTFSVGNKLLVNCALCTGTAGPRPDAARLQIYTKSVGGIRIGNHSHVAASIYAPKATCGGNPSNAGANFYGSMVCEIVTNQGAWSFHYDDRLRDLGTGGWYVKRWAEE